MQYSQMSTGYSGWQDHHPQLPQQQHAPPYIEPGRHGSQHSMDNRPSSVYSLQPANIPSVNQLNTINSMSNMSSMNMAHVSQAIPGGLMYTPDPSMAAYHYHSNITDADLASLHRHQGNAQAAASVFTDPLAFNPHAQNTNLTDFASVALSVPNLQPNSNIPQRVSQARIQPPHFQLHSSQRIQRVHPQDGLWNVSIPATVRNTSTLNTSTIPATNKVHSQERTKKNEGEPRYKCTFEGCSATFNHQWSFSQHKQLHTGEKNYKCTFEGCDRAFAQARVLRTHIRTHTKERPFKCPYVGCGADFPQTSNLKYHLRTHTGEKPYKCPHSGCDVAFAYRQGLAKHIKAHTENPESIPSFKHKPGRKPLGQLVEKMADYPPNMKPFICTHDGCQRSFATLGYLGTHIKTHNRQAITYRQKIKNLVIQEEAKNDKESKTEPQNAPSFTDKQLPDNLLGTNSYSRLGTVTRGTIHATAGNEQELLGMLSLPPLMCGQVGPVAAKQATHASMTTRERKEPIGATRFVPRETSTGRPSAAKPKPGRIPMLQQNPVARASRVAAAMVPRDPKATVSLNPKSFACPYEGCTSSYTRADNLREHERTHTGEKPFMCPYQDCTASFSYAKGLRIHKLSHTGEKPYKCQAEGCKSAYAQYGSLQYHMYEHTGEKPLSCPFEGCGKTFVKAGHLRYHLNKHTGNKPYKCTRPDCNQSFITMQSLKIHEWTHTGNMPFRCSYEGCELGFRTAAVLKVHTRKHTGDRPFACEHHGCNKRFTSAYILKNHIKLHEGKKGFKCLENGCSYTTTTEGALSKHEMLHWKGM
eukprot:Ihof_evm7s249 gene=Ihof_evmTU7s249